MLSVDSALSTNRFVLHFTFKFQSRSSFSVSGFLRLHIQGPNRPTVTPSHPTGPLSHTHTVPRSSPTLLLQEQEPNPSLRHQEASLVLHSYCNLAKIIHGVRSIWRFWSF